MRADKNVQRDKPVSGYKADERAIPFAPNSAERRRAVAEDLAPLFRAFSTPRAPSPLPAQPQTIERRRHGFSWGRGFGRWVGMGLAGAAAFGLAIGSLVGHQVHRPVRVAVTPQALRAHVPPPQPVALEAAAPVTLATMTTPAVSAKRPLAGGPGDEPSPATVRRAALRDRDCGPAGFCTRRTVMDADRALRVAYRNAIRAGVSRGELLAVRDHWADLRTSQYRRPGRLSASYADLTDDLNAMSRDARLGGRY